MCPFKKNVAFLEDLLFSGGVESSKLTIPIINCISVNIIDNQKNYQIFNKKINFNHLLNIC